MPPWPTGKKSWRPTKHPTRLWKSVGSASGLPRFPRHLRASETRTRRFSTGGYDPACRVIGRDEPPVPLRKETRPPPGDERAWPASRLRNRLSDFSSGGTAHHNRWRKGGSCPPDIPNAPAPRTGSCSRSRWQAGAKCRFGRRKPTSIGRSKWRACWRAATPRART